MRTSTSWAVAGFAAALSLFTTSGLQAADPPAKVSAPPFAPPDPAPGAFEVKPVAGGAVQLVLTGKKLTSREDVERYLLYRAAALTLERKADWFAFSPLPAPGEQLPSATPDPKGPAMSFRLNRFQPAWRYQTAADTTWKVWSPFSGKPFLDGASPGGVTAFEVTAQITPKKTAFPVYDPLAFEAAPLSDLLISSVKPPDLAAES